MLDIKYIRENIERVKDAVAQKNVEVNIDLLLKLDDERKELVKMVEICNQIKKMEAEKYHMLKILSDAIEKDVTPKEDKTK